MSYVTNVVLLFSLMEYDTETAGVRQYPIVQMLNKSAVDGMHSGALVRVSQYGAGIKVMEAVVYVGAFNFLDVDAFKRAVWALPWEEPESVQLLIKDQDDERFTLFDRSS